MARVSRIVAALFFLAVIFIALIPLGRSLGVDVARTYAAINAVIVSTFVWFSRSGSRAWGHGLIFSGLLMLARPLMRQAPNADAAGAASGVSSVLGNGIHWTPLIFLDMIVGVAFLAIGIYLSISDRKEIVIVDRKLIVRNVQAVR